MFFAFESIYHLLLLLTAFDLARHSASGFRWNLFRDAEREMHLSRIFSDRRAERLTNHTDILRDLTTRSYNFARMCQGHVIKFRNKQINVDGLVFTHDEAVKIMKILGDDDLEERMQVWTYTCEIDVLEARNGGTHMTLDIESDNKYELDILASSSQMLMLYIATYADEILSGKHGRRRRDAGLVEDHEHARVKRKMLDLYTHQWTKMISWRFTSTYTRAEKDLIKESLADWEKETCLKFKQHETSPNNPHIQFVRRSGCFAQVGMQTKSNVISLDNGCFQKGRVMHEVAHALGMWHEHSRPDRDLFVNVKWRNIRSQKTYNFVRRPWMYTNTMGVAYDFSSIMHYGSNFFGSHALGETLVSKMADYKKSMGQRKDVTFHDVMAVNKMYCSQMCGGKTLVWSKCYHEGYRDPLRCNQCRCPTGLVPPYCQIAAKGSPTCVGRENRVASSRIQTINTPRFPLAGSSPLDCYYRIIVPTGWIIKLKFHRQTSFACRTPCRDYVEIRMTYLGRSAPRYCCMDLSGKTLQSPSNEVLIIIKTYTNRRYSLSVDFWRDTCGGCHGYNNQPPCDRLRKRSIGQPVWAVCYRPIPGRTTDVFHYFCKRWKRIKFYSSSKYCCRPFTLSRDRQKCVRRLG